MAVDDDFDIPDTGAVFTFGRSRFADNAPSKFWIKNDIIVEIACGDEHTAVLTESGRVFTIGNNDMGQLGLGTTKPVLKPSCVKSIKPEKVVHIGCGRSHTIAACFSGGVYAWGHNGDGQLGTGDHVDHLSPVQILKLEAPAAGVAAGCAHSIVLTENGELYVWGNNNEGQLGMDVGEQLTPALVTLPEPVVNVACGYYHNVATSVSGQVYTWGESDHGKLGLTDSLLAFHRHPQEMILPEKVVQVAAGSAHTLLLTENGVIYSCGLGSSGELGQNGGRQECWLPKPIMETDGKLVVAIAAGANHSSAITADGFLLTWGCGRHGKLCQGEENFASHFTPGLVRRLRHIRVVLVGCGGCHTMVLGCRRHEAQGTEEGLKEENQSSNTARNRRRLLDGGLPPLKSVGLPPLKHTVLPTVPDAEDVGHHSIENDLPDTTDVIDNETTLQVECNGAKSIVRLLSESESEEEPVIQEEQKSTEKSPSPEKKPGRLARFFSSLRKKKPSSAPPEELVNGGEKQVADNTRSVDGFLGEGPLKEAFVSSGNTCASPKSQVSTNQKQMCNPWTCGCLHI
ncbi:X-linked retinitis pigmentosa GTPase regulator-like isoform X2 [Portunus trituberculatus]|uniref:X-linked retinitis pigmentosa GTPase regulator-like isoform X2 n=1 Tax=Portunus trituberculatus TaxID=210409 RepID=UPI001E1D041C|nr:X-linked retinitis pigmentosa GTPase regulator-like isoform X2 [Portunus trituberculatus]